MGFRIKELREGLGITQTELAVKSGISRTTLNRLESGQIKVTTTRTLSKLASALGVCVEELFHRRGA